MGKNIGVAQMGPLGFLLPNTPTLGAPLNAMIHYSAAVAPIFRLCLERGHEVSTLTLTPTLPMGGHLRFGHEVMLAALRTHAHALCRRHPVPFARLELPYGEPAHLDLYRELLGDVPISFERPTARLEFDSFILDHAVEFADRRPRSGPRLLDRGELPSCLQALDRAHPRRRTSKAMISPQWAGRAVSFCPGGRATPPARGRNPQSKPVHRQPIRDISH